jgi:2-(1,2-epoxy-1,2-dihydrophenyl)acetyl-CoA isomerase
MALLGRAVPAAEALTWGLVNQFTDPGDLRNRALEVAAAPGALSTSVGTTRRVINQSFERSLSDQLDCEATARGRAQHGPDFAEARQAFAQKRPPRFV